MKNFIEKRHADVGRNAGEPIEPPEIRKLKNQNNKKSSDSRIARLCKKYPRFCSIYDFTDELISQVTDRSDLWMVRLFETCYDEALAACGVEVSLKVSFYLFQFITFNFINRLVLQGGDFEMALT